MVWFAGPAVNREAEGNVVSVKFRWFVNNPGFAPPFSVFVGGRVHEGDSGGPWGHGSAEDNEGVPVGFYSVSELEMCRIEWVGMGECSDFFRGMVVLPCGRVRVGSDWYRHVPSVA